MSDSARPGRPWRRLARQVRGRVRAMPAPRPTGGSGSPTRPVDEVVRSGIFDRGHYESQAGRSFNSLEDAVRDYLRRGGPAGLSPSPLFEPEFYRPDSWSARPDALLDYLHADTPGRPSPWFDDAVHLARHAEADNHPGRALGHFIATAGPEDPLPIPGQNVPLRWREALDLVAIGVEEFARFQELRSAPRRGPWDTSVDDAFVETWSVEPVPSSDDPVVSVVMPVRNRPVQVVEAIRSVQGQSLANWELVVVDDGSTDRTPDVVAAIAREDPRVRLVQLGASGVSAARNAGIAESRSAWLAFLDSDNTWVPHFLHVMLAYLHSRSLAAGYCVIDASQTSADSERGFLVLDGGLDYLLVRNHIDLNGLVVTTKVARRAGGFDPTLRRWVDHDFAIRVARETQVRLVPFVGVRYDHADTSRDRITLTESEHWQWVALGKNYLDWDSLATGLVSRTARRVSVCVPTHQDWRRTSATVTGVLAAADELPPGAPGSDVEVVVVDNGSRRAVASLLRALFHAEARVRVRSVPRNLNFAIGSNLAFAESSGAVVAFLSPGAEVTSGWLGPLLDALEDESIIGAQPLLLNSRGTALSAGWLFPGGDLLPSPLLVDHPLEDVLRLSSSTRRAVDASALAMRAEDVVALRGFDPLFVEACADVDLCLRAGALGARRFMLATASRVVRHSLPELSEEARVDRRLMMERWRGHLPASELALFEELRLTVAALSAGDPVTSAGDVPVPRPVIVRDVSATEIPDPALRWALKTDVSWRARLGGQGPPDRAEELASALTRLGHHVVIDHAESGQRPTTYLDDVAVAVRGPRQLVEDAGRINVLWPEEASLVTSEEAARYDAVVAVSRRDPAEVAGALVRTVSSLLRASPPGGSTGGRLKEEHGLAVGLRAGADLDDA